MSSRAASSRLSGLRASVKKAMTRKGAGVATLVDPEVPTILAGVVANRSSKRTKASRFFVTPTAETPPPPQPTVTTTTLVVRAEVKRSAENPGGTNPKRERRSPVKKRGVAATPASASVSYHSVASPVRRDAPTRRRSPIKKSLPKTAPPPGFDEVWEVIERARRVRDAPVDLLGADALGEWFPPRAHPPTAEEYRFAVLIALMLSSQTKDNVVATAVRGLKTSCEEAKSRPFGPHYILSLAEADLDTAIKQVGFHNNKTKFLRQSCRLLLDPSFASEEGRVVGAVPGTTNGLLELPGVGPKMAFLVLAIGFKAHFAGIGVDTHMHRICHDVGWVDDKSHARGPDSSRVVLESFVPLSKWPTINLLFVGFGQQAQQQRIKMIRRCCGTDPADPDFPEALAVPTLRLLAKAGGITTARGHAYILRAVEVETGETALMWAAESGWLDAVQYLLDLGCSASSVDADSRTAAAHAAAKGHAKVAAVLRKAERT